MEAIRKFWYGQPTEKAADSPEHFAKVAFAVSSLVLFLLSPLNFLLSALAGAALHYAIQPDPQAEVKKIESSDAVFAIVGAVAEVLKWTPAGRAGNFLFQAIPFLCTLSIGSTLYEFFSAKT